jgi:hypothetical protein
LIGYARIRHLLPTLLHPHGASTLSTLNPQPPPAAPAHRLRAATWLNGRTALGAALVVLAVRAGALFLDRLGVVLRAQAADVREQHKRDLIEAGGRREVLMLVPVVFLELPVVILFALYPGLFSLSQLAR